MSSIIIILIYAYFGAIGIRWYAKNFTKDIEVSLGKAYLISLTGYVIDFLILWLLAQWVLNGTDFMGILKKTKKLYWVWGLCQLIIYPSVVIFMTKTLLKIDIKKATIINIGNLVLNLILSIILMVFANFISKHLNF